MVRIKAHKPLTVNKAAYREIPYLSVLKYSLRRATGSLVGFAIAFGDFGGIE